MTDQAINHDSIVAALAAFQAELPKIAKGNEGTVQTKAGGQYSYQYADLADITGVALPLLAKHGLAWVAQPTVSEAHGFVLAYSLLHTTGGAIKGEYPLPAPQTPAQQLGAAITYARRYCLCSVTGIAPGGDDSDAAAAQQHTAAYGPPADWQEKIASAASIDALTALYHQANREGWAAPEIMGALNARKRELENVAVGQ